MKPGWLNRLKTSIFSFSCRFPPRNPDGLRERDVEAVYRQTLAGISDEIAVYILKVDGRAGEAIHRTRCAGSRRAPRTWFAMRRSWSSPAATQVATPLGPTSRFVPEIEAMFVATRAPIGAPAQPGTDDPAVQTFGLCMVSAAQLRKI